LAHWMQVSAPAHSLQLDVGSTTRDVHDPTATADVVVETTGAVVVTSAVVDAAATVVDAGATAVVVTAAVLDGATLGARVVAARVVEATGACVVVAGRVVATGADVGHTPHVAGHTEYTKAAVHRPWDRRLAQSSGSITPLHRRRVVVVVSVAVDDVTDVAVRVVTVTVVENVVDVRQMPQRFGHDARTRLTEHDDVGVTSQPFASVPPHTGSAVVTVVVSVTVLIVVVVVVVDVVDVAVVGAFASGTMTPPPQPQQAVDAVKPKLE
jgi:hypothetical protein